MLRVVERSGALYFLGAIILLGVFVPALAGAQSEALTITDVRVSDIDSVKQVATITWNTNLFSQGLVVCGNYSKAPFTFDVTKPNFGYTWSTALITSLVKEHKMPLAGLTAGEHYCRAASRTRDDGSWVVSDEVTFVIDGMVDGVPVKGTSSSPEEGKVTTQNSFDSDTEGVTEEESAPSRNVCSAEWWVWALVLIVLLATTVWSKEMLKGLSSQDSVKRLYVIAISGLVVFIIAFFREVGYWILPVGLGTIAIIVSAIVDIVRTKEGDAPQVRLNRISASLVVAFLVALFLALILGWTCSILPLIVVIAALTARRVLNERQQATKV